MLGVYMLLAKSEVGYPEV